MEDRRCFDLISVIETSLDWVWFARFARSLFASIRNTNLCNLHIVSLYDSRVFNLIWQRYRFGVIGTSLAQIHFTIIITLKTHKTMELINTISFKIYFLSSIKFWRFFFLPYDWHHFKDLDYIKWLYFTILNKQFKLILNRQNK